MNADPSLLRYREARKRFYEDLERAKTRLDALLDKMLEHPATLQDLAQLEGLHAEKHRLFTEFVKTEDAFIAQLLAERKQN